MGIVRSIDVSTMFLLLKKLGSFKWVGKEEDGAPAWKFLENILKKSDAALLDRKLVRMFEILRTGWAGKGQMYRK